MRTAVLLPCHNEALTIESAIAGFREVLPEAEIWVCDNASTDATAALAAAGGARIIHETRLGKGQAVRRLFADVDADVYVIADGDATYDPACAPAMVARLLDDRLDMVVGNRLNVRREGLFRRGHHFGNRLFSTIIRWFFGSTITDVLSGYRVMSRRFVKSFPAESRGFEIETELTVTALEARFPIAEVPTEYRSRPEGSESKLSTYGDGARILRTVFLLLRDIRPLEFFTTLAAVLALSGLTLFYPLLETFRVTHRVPRFPTLIGVVAVWVLAVVFVTCGIILDRIAAARRIQHRLAYLRFRAPDPEETRTPHQTTVASTGGRSVLPASARSYKGERLE
jgi:glycosyltransferase involved in cell wall biosynthesis